MTTQSTDDVSHALDAMHARISALEAAVARTSTPAASGGSGSSAAPATSSAANTQKDLESAVDQMVAGALLRGRHTAGVLNGMFNLTPGLSGR